MNERIDKALVLLKLVSSRARASQLIKEKVVFLKGQLIKKSSVIVDLDTIKSEDFEIKKDQFYVGRGALKLEGALDFFKIDPTDLIIIDVGASTGGFTDCLLQKGAKKSYCIDVGHGQLASSLVNDGRVANYEGINIRKGIDLPEKGDLIVADLSYISLELVLDKIFSLGHEKSKFIILIKPQFEVGKDKIGKSGLVKNSNDRLYVLTKLLNWCHERSFFVTNAMVSSTPGKTGNIEYFFFFDRESVKDPISQRDLESLC